jgi:hypothetical protein
MPSMPSLFACSDQPHLTIQNTAREEDRRSAGLGCRAAVVCGARRMDSPPLGGNVGGDAGGLEQGVLAHSPHSNWAGPELEIKNHEADRQELGNWWPTLSDIQVRTSIPKHSSPRRLQRRIALLGLPPTKCQHAAHRSVAR